MKLDDIPFIVKSMDEEMPIHTPTNIKIPTGRYGNLPKNLMDTSVQVMDKYLDNHLHSIEEIKYKFPEHYLPKTFNVYATQYFNKHGILKDSFFKTNEFGDFGSTKYYGGMTIQNVGFLGISRKVNGSTITIGDQSSTVNVAIGDIWASILTGAVVNTYYDQVSVDIQTVSGNQHIGAYDDSGGNPNSLLCDTGSLASFSGFGLKSVTEFKVTTTTLWLATEPDSTSAFFYNLISSGNGRTKTGSYRALDASYTSPINQNRILHQKIAHS